MEKIENIIYCVRCGSDNVEPLVGRKYYCAQCEKLFTIEDFRMAYKIANKKLALETGEMKMEDIIDSSMNYIFKRGVMLGPHIEEELRTHVGVIPDEAILSKLSYLECTTEDMSSKE